MPTFWQENDKQRLVWQLFPKYPVGQVHEYFVLLKDEQVPPFWQGLEKQRFVSQLFPKYPAGQEQL